MKLIMAILTALSVLLGALPFIRPRSRSGQALMWVPKLLGGALSPIAGLTGALAALIGVARRDYKLAGAGLLGAGLAVRLAVEMPDVDQELAGLPAPDREGPARASRPPLPARLLGQAEFERDIVVGHNPQSGQALRADLWPPSDHVPSGLGLVYAHGSGWRVGGKDMLTRSFFRRLAAQGHLVLDVGYSLWPHADMPAMVNEMNQAILWLKENGPAYGVNPDRIVLMGGSAGGHLALLAAYTPGHPAFRPAGAVGDTSVRGVVAFYPPVDLLAMPDEAGLDLPSSPGLVDRIAQAMFKFVFLVREEPGHEKQFGDIIAEMLGGTVAEVPDTYRLLSPIYHIGAHCPPTLLLHGSDDVFGLTPGVRRLRECLRAAGVPSALIEFPHTEHGFDLLLPRISLTARAATRGVEQFLAWLE